MDHVLPGRRGSVRIGTARRAARAPCRWRQHDESLWPMAPRSRPPRAASGDLSMALHHCRSGEVARLGAPDAPATATAALARTPSFEAVHLVVRAGASLAPHPVPGPLTLYCIAGIPRLGGPAPAALRAGGGVVLDPGPP